MTYEHGGDIAGYILEYGRPPLDFSASLNPMGMPPAVREAACAAVGEAAPYPDPLARRLTAALAQKLQLPETAIILGNGSVDVLYRLVQTLRPKTALLPVPSFSEYAHALEGAGCAVRHHHWDAARDFEPDDSLLAAIRPGDDLLFLCQPNNPTGRLVPSALLEAVLARCAETGTRLFLDECFVPLLDAPGAVSLLPRLMETPGLFILGSFTKLYAMAGLRLGFGLCADTALAEALRKNGQPWAVSTVAQAAGLAALAEDDYVAASRRMIAAERARLAEDLAALGLRVIGGAANYLFFHAADPALHLRLARRGILIRSCANFRGLGPGYYRVAVLAPAQNRQLVAALAACQQAENDLGHNI